MSIETFDLKMLSEMDDGRMRVLIEGAVARAHADCKDRPALDKARKVRLDIWLEPVPDGTDLESVMVTFDVRELFPARTSRRYNMRSTKQGLLFNDASPDAARQGTLDKPVVIRGGKDAS